MHQIQSRLANPVPRPNGLRLRPAYRNFLRLPHSCHDWLEILEDQSNRSAQPSHPKLSAWHLPPSFSNSSQQRSISAPTGLWVLRSMNMVGYAPEVAISNASAPKATVLPVPVCPCTMIGRLFAATRCSRFIVVMRSCDSNSRRNAKPREYPDQSGRTPHSNRKRLNSQ